MLELMNEPIWVCWNLWTRAGKSTKVPRAANGGATGTDEKYRSTWVTYEKAALAMREHGYTGIGFILPKGYFFLDVDHKDENDPLLKRLAVRFSTYMERSFSGNGYHLYGKCDLSALPVETKTDGRLALSNSYYTKNPANGLELYIGGLTNRFAVYTGDVVQDEHLNNCTVAVLETLNREMKRTPHQSDTCNEPVDDAECFDIVCNLRKDANSAKFIRLYDHGDTTGFTSQSEADASLCAMIAFRAGNRPAVIDSVFRSSALYREEKWSRQDYREATIACGIAACHGSFHYSVREKPAFVVYNSQSKKEEVVCTLLARHFREQVHYAFVRDDARNSVLRYVYEGGVYRLYSDDMLKGLIKGFVMAYSETLVRMSQINEVFAQITTDNVFTTMDALNADENLINFNNGLLRLSDLTLLPHTPEVLTTIRIPCDWSGVPCDTPVFDRYLHTLLDGDEAMKLLVMEFMGACLSNLYGWRMKKAIFFYGDGDTGKSVLKSLTERLLGKGNYVGIDLAELEARFGTANLYGKRMAGSSDMSFLSVDELKSFKKVTGGDSLFAEFKGQNGFEFVYNGLLWFCMNRLPKFGGDDGPWVYDRIMQIACKNVIPAAKQDKTLLDRLYSEREGILFKAIMALKGVIANGYRFSEPKAVTEARQTYQQENNTVLAFFHECMVSRSCGKISDQCTTGRVYNVYAAWCKDNNHGYAKTAKEFRDYLASFLGVTVADMTVRRKFGVAYRDYTLTDDAKSTYLKAYGYDATMAFTAGCA